MHAAYVQRKCDVVVFGVSGMPVVQGQNFDTSRFAVMLAVCCFHYVLSVQVSFSSVHDTRAPVFTILYLI